MSTTVISTINTTGVRRLRTLGSWCCLGASADMISGMIGEGYDPSVINALAAAGASDIQLQNLWNNYAAGSQDFAVAANQLLTSLTGGPGGAASAPGYPSGAQPTTISTAFGVFDLLQQSSWDAINSLFISAQQRLNALASKNPKDPDIVSMVQEFNSNVAQWANYYAQAVGNAPANIPLASIPTLSGLGIAPLIIVGIVAAVAALIAWLYGFITGKIAQKEAAQAALLTAQNQSSLLTQYNAAQSSGNTQLAAQLAAMLKATGTPPPQPPGTTNWSTWFQQNFGLLLAALVGIAIVPPLLRQRR